jgi:hypothetical protein
MLQQPVDCHNRRPLWCLFGLLLHFHPCFLFAPSFIVVEISSSILESTAACASSHYCWSAGILSTRWSSETLCNFSIKVNSHKKRGFKLKAHRIWKFLECVYGLNGELGKVNSEWVVSASSGFLSTWCKWFALIMSVGKGLLMFLYNRHHSYTTFSDLGLFYVQMCFQGCA